MNRHYIFPVCVAAVAHGALLFGFTRNPADPIPRSEIKVLFRPFPLPLEEETPVSLDTDRTESKTKVAPEVPPPPRSAEPPKIDITDPFRVPPRPVGRTEVAADIKQFFEDSVGDSKGKGTSPWANGVIPSALLDNSPRTRFQASPMYPFEARRDGLRGEVIVEFMVDERGRVLEPRVVSSTHRIFEEATLRAVAKWQFEPGRRDGQVVRFRMAAPVVFNLSE